VLLFRQYLMDDRKTWEAATEAQRRLAVGADTELRRRYPEVRIERLWPAEPEEVTDEQRAGARPSRTPAVVSRQPYDRGSGQKQGQLSWGTGSTPTFFGPGGDRYLTIADNADSQEHLLIYRIDPKTGASRLICRTPIFTPGASAAENAPIGVGHSVVIVNTYGYNYQIGAHPGPIPGGLTRIDVRKNGSGCDTRWTSAVPSVAVPKLSTRDGDIYTVQRAPTGTTANYAMAVIDSGSGRTLALRALGSGLRWETLQLAGVTSRTGVFYQGTVAGIAAIRPASAGK